METTVAFVPVLHSGYVRFFEKHPGTLYMLGDEFLEELPHLDREIRKVDLEKMRKVVGALGFFDEVRVLTKANVSELSLAIVMPDEDSMHLLAEKYFPQHDVSFESIFLRWDRKISDKEFEIAPHRVISEEVFDREILSRAEKEAQKSDDWWRQIGAIAVKDGAVLFSSYNRHLPSHYNLAVHGDPRSNFNYSEKPELYTSIHAEADIVAQAARTKESLEGSHFYSTTFPCPNCARLLVRAGIKKVFYAKGYSLLDAEDILNAAGIEIVLVK